MSEMDGYTRLKELLTDPVFNQFEYILIDSPPSLGMLSVNALAASTHFVVPMSPALYTMQGTNDLMTTVEKVKRNFNPSLQTARRYNKRVRQNTGNYPRDKRRDKRRVRRIAFHCVAFPFHKGRRGNCPKERLDPFT